ncbi:LexA repressor-like protein [Paenibacillus larvae subsp. larvae DSM 25430]|nr:LexA repressor-like protein [Paenibacillus larvae subsp. larvae DSM 25430]
MAPFIFWNLAFYTIIRTQLFVITYVKFLLINVKNSKIHISCLIVFSLPLYKKLLLDILMFKTDRY